MSSTVIASYPFSRIQAISASQSIWRVRTLRRSIFTSALILYACLLIDTLPRSRIDFGAAQISAIGDVFYRYRVIPFFENPSNKRIAEHLASTDLAAIHFHFGTHTVRLSTN